MEENEVNELMLTEDFQKKVAEIALKLVLEEKAKEKKKRGPGDEGRAIQIAKWMSTFCTAFKGSNGAMYVQVDNRKYPQLRMILPLQDISPTAITLDSLIGEIYKLEKEEPVKPSILTTACGMFVNSARVNALEVQTAIRVAHIGTGSDTVIIIDRSDTDESKCYIKLSRAGIEIGSDSGGFYFIDEGTNGVLPIPDTESVYSTLPPLLALSAEDKKIVFLWCMQTLLPMNAYVNLALDAATGSGKSTVVSYLRSITDPNRTFFSETGLPDKPIDFMVTGARMRILSYDNIEDMPKWFNALACRVSRGADMPVKTLFTTGGRTKLSTKNPLIFSGIQLVREMKSDLIRRSLILKVPERARNSNTTEERLKREFHAIHPQLLGALCNAIVGALRHIDEVPETGHGSMPEFRRWAVAAGIELGWSENEVIELIDKYQDPKRDSNPLLSSPFLALVVRLVENSPSSTYYGTPSNLLRIVRNAYMDATGGTEFPANFPLDGTRCSIALRNSRDILRKYDIIVLTPDGDEKDHGADGNRIFIQQVRMPEERAIDNNYKINVG